MPKVTDYQILSALDRGLPVPVVADQLGVPLRRVARINTGGRSAHDPKRPLPPQYGMLLPKAVNLAIAPSPATADYWTGLGGVGKPRRVARLVPDDRSDEALTFDDVVDITATALSVLGGREEKGRGAA